MNAYAAREDRYAVVLADKPVAALATAGQSKTALEGHSKRLMAAQSALKTTLLQKKLAVLGGVQTVANAIFVSATPAQAQELRSLPGVVRVERMRRYKRQLNRAVDLVNASAGWSVLGGPQNAGLGTKIAILDTGIDQTHPSLQDSGLQPPGGYPICSGDDCKYTSNKVIVARSYVLTLATYPNAIAGGSAPEDVSRPDDLSPRDRVGHGTAMAAIAAAAPTDTPVGRISGVAPKAFLGNYKIFGSPGVNDFTFEDVVVKALDDAFSDGMDVAAISIGDPADWGPNDSGAVCGNSAGVPCGLFAAAVETASARMAIVVPSGNYGGDGLKIPSLNTIGTPGTANSAITVGASTNSHIFYASVRMGNNAPSNLQQIDTMFGDAARLSAPLTAPLRDVSKLGNDGLACSALPAGSLAGAVALIQTGNCNYIVKVNNAQAAGALGVVLYRGDGSNALFLPKGMAGTGLPLALIGSDNGNALKSFLASTPNASATLDPTLRELDAPSDTVAYFSSEGPSIGEGAIKPELVAVGTDLYVPTQKYDTNADMYDPTGYIAVEGSSFAVPMVAGAIAMLKQRNGSLTPAQFKSLVVNTANNSILDVNGQGHASVLAMGAGKLDVGAALKSNVTVTPSTLSFGDVSQASSNPSQTLLITNTGNARVSLTLGIDLTTPENNSHIVLSGTTLNLNPGQGSTITVALNGTAPQPGEYEGAITIQGGAVPVRVPFLYLSGGGQADNMIPIRSYDFVAIAGAKRFGMGALEFKIVDQAGVPVPNVPIRFTPSLNQQLGTNDPCPARSGIYYATPTTDDYGIGYAELCVGPQLGEQAFTATAGAMSLTFVGRILPPPTINSGGVVNAASFQGGGLAPGSYISIFGSGFSEASGIVATPYLPLSLVGVSVSFDRPDLNLSLPGRLVFVQPGQVNVQIPWEFQGADSAKMKVSYGDFQTAIYNVPLAKYSPGIFEYADPASGKSLGTVLDDQYAVVSGANPAVGGKTIQIFCNGLGPVSNQPASGELSPATSLAMTKVTPVVTIGGASAPVSFSGLAPGLVGLYQVNVTVPSGITPGVQPLVISMEGSASKTVNLPVQ